jgi:hypothetical protein
MERYMFRINKSGSSFDFLIFFLVTFFTLTALISCGGSGGSSGEFSSDNNIITEAIIVNHTTLNVDTISDEAINEARSIAMSLDHASVGVNIKNGMEALKAIDAKWYNYPNWDWHNRGNPGWKEKVDQFVAWVADHTNEYDVFHMKFCYIDTDIPERFSCGGPCPSRLQAMTIVMRITRKFATSAPLMASHYTTLPQ